MGILTISIDNETEAILRNIAKTKDMKKGSISAVLKEALLEYNKKLKLNEIQTRELNLLKRGFNWGYKGYKDRGELHGRGTD